MAVVEVAFHPAAEEEYLTSPAWYYVRSPLAAERFEMALDRAIDLIRSHPSMFPLCDHRHRDLLLHRFPYQLVYRVEGEMVKIIAVAHTRRRPRSWSGRE